MPERSTAAALEIPAATEANETLAAPEVPMTKAPGAAAAEIPAAVPTEAPAEAPGANEIPAARATATTEATEALAPTELFN